MKTVRLNIRLPQALHARLKALVARRGLTLQDWVLRQAQKQTGLK